MKYIVFEAGSRAGFSAEMFYRAWKKRHPESNVGLIMADSDTTFAQVPAPAGVEREPCFALPGTVPSPATS